MKCFIMWPLWAVTANVTVIINGHMTAMVISSQIIIGCWRTLCFSGSNLLQKGLRWQSERLLSVPLIPFYQNAGCIPRLYHNISLSFKASPLILPVSLTKCSFHALSWLDFGHHLELINLYEIIDLNRSMQDIYSHVDFFRVCGVKSMRNDFNTCIAEDLTNKLNTTSELWGLRVQKFAKLFVLA